MEGFGTRKPNNELHTDDSIFFYITIKTKTEVIKNQ